MPAALFLDRGYLGLGWRWQTRAVGHGNLMTLHDLLNLNPEHETQRNANLNWSLRL